MCNFSARITDMWKLVGSTRSDSQICLTRDGDKTRESNPPVPSACPMVLRHVICIDTRYYATPAFQAACRIGLKP